MKAIFLDRDGTINVDRRYVHRIEDFDFLPGAVEGLRILQDAGYALIVITNQSGIARGYYTEEDFLRLNAYMAETLAKRGVVIADTLYCPHLPDAKIIRYRKDCGCRKPKPGLYYEAAKKWDIDFSQSWAVGDRARDCAICAETDCKGILIRPRISTEPPDSMPPPPGTRYAESLLEAALEITGGKWA